MIRMSETYLRSVIQPCFVREWYLKRIKPVDPSFGNGINKVVCARCNKPLELDQFASRRISMVNDDWGLRASIDIYCVDCFDIVSGLYKER